MTVEMQEIISYAFILKMSWSGFRISEALQLGKSQQQTNEWARATWFPYAMDGSTVLLATGTAQMWLEKPTNEGLIVISNGGCLVLVNVSQNIHSLASVVSISLGLLRIFVESNQMEHFEK